jgi:HAD superfamily hydrolase (TIGR01509 family)
LPTSSCLVLDFDGTVLDTEEPLFLSWQALYVEHGHDLDLATWQGHIGTDDPFDPWDDLEALVGTALDPAHRARRQLHRDGLIEARAVQPGILDWLDAAEALGLPVGIASSSPPDWVEGHLARLGLRHRFATLACCDEAIPAKPDPTSYRLVCERLGADPVCSVAVEDSPHGVRAALAAGLFTVAVPHGLTADLDLSAADLVVASLAELTLHDVLASARA